MDNLSLIIPNKHLVNIISEYVQFELPYRKELLFTTYELYGTIKQCHTYPGKIPSSPFNIFRIRRCPRPPKKVNNKYEWELEWNIGIVSHPPKKLKKYILGKDEWVQTVNPDYYQNIKTHDIINFTDFPMRKVMN